MANRSQRRGAKAHPPKPVNAAPAFQALRNMSTKYQGAARFIEIAPPGIQFRAFANVDHITNISFANKVETIQVPIEGTGSPEVVDNDGVILVPAVAPDVKSEQRIVGWTVTLNVGGQQNEFTFTKLDVGVRCYHEILDSIIALGVPCAVKQRIAIEKKEVDVDAVAEAVAEGLSVNEDHDDDDLISELQDVVDENTVAVEDKEIDEPTQH